MVAEGERGHMGRLQACSAASGNPAAAGPAAAAAAGGCPAVHDLLDRPRRAGIPAEAVVPLHGGLFVVRRASGLSGL